MSEDPVVTACIYRVWLEHCDPDEPLWRTPYFGQVVRSGASNKNVEARWKEEVRLAGRETKAIGFMAVLNEFGADAMEWTLVESQNGPRSIMQPYADATEKRLIAESGGVLRDMDTKLKQTLNLLPGGKGANWWKRTDAWRMKKLRHFKAEMETYVNEYGTALVPTAYVNALTGYKLGQKLGGFRSGQMRGGLPQQQEIEAWAEILPGWAWDATTTSEWHEKWLQAVKDGHNTTNYLDGASTRARQQWAEADDSTRARWVDAQTKARHEPVYIAKQQTSQSEAWKRRLQDHPEVECARSAKHTATRVATREAKRAKMSPEERRKEEAQYIRSQHSMATAKANLQLLRTVEPNAKQSDLPRARRDGLLARLQASVVPT